MRAHSAYKTTQRATYDPMQIEYDLLIRTARDLELTENGDAPERVGALMRNVKLWQAMAYDLAEAGNPLPDQLKAQIISLAVWTVGHTQKAVVGEAPLDPLIEVNRTIARGLLVSIERRRAEGTLGAPPPAAPTTNAQGA